MIGRPPKPPDRVRSKRIRIRLSDEELAELEVQAQGRSLPELIRETLEKELQTLPSIPEADPRIAGQLSQAGNRLNQLVRLAHTGHASEQLEPLLRQLYETVIDCRRELRRLQTSMQIAAEGGEAKDKV